jgi:formimidoylglutamate deiminase
MNAAEIGQVARSGAVVGLCPTTEANLGDGLFNAVDYLDAGGLIGIGSDSHCSINPVEELRWLEYGQRLLNRRRNLLAGAPGRSTGRNLLEMILAGGSQACGRRIGALEVGHRADLITLNTSHPSFYAREGDTLLDSWLFSTNEPLIDTVAVAGRIVIKSGRHADESRIRERFHQTLKRLQLKV